MRCPVDDAPLREVTRSGVKIDLCNECRGVWLDRGELDHLLEAASAADAEFDGRAAPLAAPTRDRVAPEPTRAQPDPRATRRDRDDDDDDDDRPGRTDRRRSDGYAGPERKKSRFGWLSDILEGGE